MTMVCKMEEGAGKRCTEYALTGQCSSLQFLPCASHGTAYSYTQINGQLQATEGVVIKLGYVTTTERISSKAQNDWGEDSR